MKSFLPALGALVLVGSGVTALSAPAFAAGETCGNQAATLVVPADQGAVPFEGTPDADVIYVTGTAEVRGLGGNDVICGPTNAPASTGGQWFGGDGDDTLTSTSASLTGGEGNDTLTGSAGTLDGGAGNDVLNGNGATALTGGDGDDTLTSTTATLDGGAGNDKLTGGGTTLDGGAGNDQVRGGAGENTVLGGAGDDVLWGGTGADVLDGGDGVDVIHASGRDRIRVGGPSRTTIDANARTIDAPGGRDTYTGSPIIWAPDATDETFVGSNRADVFISGGGADLIYGSGGNDRLTAVQPTRLEGGPGDDEITVAFGAARLRAGAGDDRIRTLLATDDAPAGIKAQPFNIEGNTGDDVVYAASLTTAGALANPVPADQMWSGRVRGGVGWDRVVFTPVKLGVTASMTTGQATWAGGTMTLGGVQALWGTPGNDVLTGNGGRNSLLGGAGDDELNGNGGRDDLRGSSGYDRLNGGTSIDRCRGEVKVSCER
jgi:hemolysin type calcium-binding protein